MKRKYEGVIVLDVRGKEQSVDDLVSRIGREIEEAGARLEQIDQLGKKDFAYNARHMESGFYVSYQFETEPAIVEQIQEKFRLDDDVFLQHFQRL